MTERVILIDMDDTLCDQTTPWLNQFNREHQTNIRNSDIKVWNKEYALKSQIPSLTTSDVFVPFNTDGFFRNLPIMPGARTALEQMKALGWRAVIVTSLPRRQYRPGQIIQEKLEWLAEHLSGVIRARDVVATPEKYLVSGDVLIDDAEHNLELFRGPTIAFDQPWNQHAKSTSRIENWFQSIRACEEIFRRLDERKDTV